MKRVRIKLGATIYHDHRAYLWPDHAGKDRNVCTCNATFNAEPFGKNDLKLTRKGFGLKGDYGSGAIILEADGVEP